MSVWAKISLLDKETKNRFKPARSVNRKLAKNFRVFSTVTKPMSAFPHVYGIWMDVWLIIFLPLRWYCIGNFPFVCHHVPIIIYSKIRSVMGQQIHKQNNWIRCQHGGKSINQQIIQNARNNLIISEFINNSKLARTPARQSKQNLKTKTKLAILIQNKNTKRNEKKENKTNGKIRAECKQNPRLTSVSTFGSRELSGVAIRVPAVSHCRQFHWY